MTEEFRLEVGNRYKDGTQGELGTCMAYCPDTDTYVVVGGGILPARGITGRMVGMSPFRTATIWPYSPWTINRNTNHEIRIRF